MSAKIFALDQDGRWTRAHDPLTGSRAEIWRIDLLNLEDVAVGTLDGVTDGEFTLNVNATIRGGGSVEYTGEPQDWNKYRIQPWYRTEAGDLSEEWPIGVFIVATPAAAYSDAGRAVSLELYDKTQILNDDMIPASYQVPAGTNVIEAVRAVLAAAGQTRTALEETEQTLATSMVWPAGTTRLRIINDLLDTANYFSIWVDGDGVFRATAYRDPKYRGVTWTFEDNEKSIYSPDFTHDFDTFAVPNRVIVTGQTDGDTPAPVAVASDTSGGPFSYQKRGRWITRYEEGQEASDQATLNSIAARLLAEGQQVGSTYQIQHAPIPLNVNSVVNFRRKPAGIDISATVQTVSYSMTTGALCSTTLREFK